jgi:hypothetical protein
VAVATPVVEISPIVLSFIECNLANDAAEQKQLIGDDDGR